MWKIQGKTRGSRQAQKRSVREATELRRPEATMGRGGCHGQPVVVATAVVATSPPGMPRVLTTVRFPARFFDLCYFFSFKRRMYLALF